MPTPAASRAALEITRPTRRRTPLARSVAVGMVSSSHWHGDSDSTRVRDRKTRRAAAQPDTTRVARDTVTVHAAVACRPPRAPLGDSVAADSAARAGTITKPPRRIIPSAREAQRVLRVIAPADASISVDGTKVGRGNWAFRIDHAGRAHRDGLSHRVQPAASAAQERREVQVAASGTTTASLRHTRAAVSRSMSLPSGAHSPVSCAGGRRSSSGTAPTSSVGALPEGKYTLRVCRQVLRGLLGQR